ncbi:related to dehydrogenases and related proteins [Cephalotrichum gorgonifer]|uniref:Related to dehydrogenases and related proteins n=1 Tax=Cephalotrichum gorgonifer TaxID=2041049 RepID=A0AAE8MXB4_9PEZI|nr:related to dehydrogenases and related proteins [Cephalotrichum gorgonifer]
MATGVALLGAGIFAREQHLPAIEACDTLSLKAIYSRSQSSASTLAGAAKNAPDVYFDSPDSPNTLDALLARTDIQAVIVVLPILTQPDIIKKALEAGKHVLSEKPVAKDVESARELLAWYAAFGGGKAGKPIWSVAENFRFLPSVLSGAEALGKIGGDVVTFALESWGYMEEDNKYFNTAWRKVPEYQGGFLLDAGVHWIAGLRLLLDATSSTVASVSARTALVYERLAPVDTMHGTITTSSGRTGTFAASFASEFKSGLTVSVTTKNGSVSVTPFEVVITTKGENGEKKVDTKKFDRDFGVPSEVKAFAAAIGAGKADDKQSPEEALKDLEILEALLESGKAGGAVKTI